MMEKDYKPFDCTLDEYAGYVGRREYWDDFSHEWGYSPLELKIIRLAGFVNQGGDLNALLENYADGRDETYRERIQYCVFNYIKRMMPDIYFEPGTPLPDRIKRLDKEELAELLSETLKKSVKIGSYLDRNGEVHECWQIGIYKNDDILDTIERRHWRANPDESFMLYLRKCETWKYRCLW